MAVSADCPVRDISDTARWAAAFRARENQRADALFRDPFADKLAGRRGFEIARALSTEFQATSWVVRTYLFDQFVLQAASEGVDLVLNLGAGLDARPYRINLSSALEWVEVDLPEILAYKERILANEHPRCALRRVPLDLRERGARWDLLQALHRPGRKILVLTEGLLIYWPSEDVAALAADLAVCGEKQTWISDLASLGVVENMRRTAGEPLAEAGARFLFGPPEGASFFSPYGWRLDEVRSVLRNAVRLNRTSLAPQVAELISDAWPAPTDPTPWVGVCRFQQVPRTSTAEN